ncbi:hypothetical protein LPW11_00605 [Geomonas sp. RF6]|uniref:hypothetical protein n=1 Tax=Geomonas sp. RF6 TaxID=2897342 RepID=UPI001E327BB6|nr:hypothetical protein [Geomonas sp. RF6]UFS70705.1 hypothetical protein LPW11_00605 [Geomonas sp. RF6]
MSWFGSTLTSVYQDASDSARSAFNSVAKTTKAAAAGLEKAAVSAGRSAAEKLQHGVVSAKEKAREAARYVKLKARDGAQFVHKEARRAKEYIGQKADAAKRSVRQKVAAAKKAVQKRLKPQPAGARIQHCPKGKKADRVAERKSKIARSNEKLQHMPPGKSRDVLAHAAQRLERNNVAVERARLAEDVYHVRRGDPPEGWDRVSDQDLRKLGGTSDMFPQLRPDFNPEEYKDGYYPELYKAKKDVFGEERYVLAFRGTQGKDDILADGVQAIGGETGHYTTAIKTAQKLKKKLGDRLDITGHSMGGGMATAAGIITGSPTYAIDPAGVHPETIERFGKEYTRNLADSNVQNFVTDGEVLDTMQQPGVQRAVLLGMGAVAPPAAAALALAGHRAMAQNGTLTYAAAGPVYKLPVLENAEDIVAGRSEQGMSPGLGGRLRNRLSLLKKADLHKTAYVIAGMEQQKADDINVIDKSLRR